MADLAVALGRCLGISSVGFAFVAVRAGLSDYEHKAKVLSHGSCLCTVNPAFSVEEKDLL